MREVPYNIANDNVDLDGTPDDDESVSVSDRKDESHEDWIETSGNK